VQVWRCFLFLTMLARVVNGRSKLLRVRLRTEILRLRALMDGIIL
jgi:hypothetical protein